MKNYGKIAPRRLLTSGQRVWEANNGEVVVTSNPRHISGGYVVDVEVPEDRLAEFKAHGCGVTSWTACTDNLHVLLTPQEQTDLATLDRCRDICARTRGFTTEDQFAAWVRSEVPHLAHLL